MFFARVFSWALMLHLAAMPLSGSAQDIAVEEDGKENGPQKAAKKEESPKEAPSDISAVKMPHPGEAFRLNQYVFDTTGILTPDEFDQIQLRALSFTQETGFPLAVVMLKDLKETGLSGGDINLVARQLLEQFVEGRRDKGADQAFLILISRGDRMIRIQKGKKWEEDVSGPIQEIIDGTMIPHLKAHRSSTNPKLDYAGAVVKGISKMLEVLYRYRVVEKPILSASLDRFAAKSWLWILLGLHLLGLVYVLCTKESEGWYLAGILFGLPILISMLIFVLQGDEDLLEQEVNARFRAFGKGGGGNHATVWGYW